MADVVIIGDDLTGSNATGALYAMGGLAVVTVADIATAERIQDDVDVLVFNTESRHLPGPAASARVAEVVAFAAGTGAQIAKRVDTTLRGNIAAEVAAGLAALRARRDSGRQAVLMVPAFPASERVTVGGCQFVQGVPVARSWAAGDPFTPVTTSRVSALFSGMPGLRTRELGLEDLNADLAASLATAGHSADVVVVDAYDDADLLTVAKAAQRAAESGDLEWLVVDTGPFGVALSRQRGLGGGRTEQNPLILVMAGSLTEQTRAQLDHLAATSDARLITVDPAVDAATDIVERLAQAAMAGHSVIGLRTVLPSGPPTAEAADTSLRLFADVARAATERLRPAAIYATGGDVAMTVLRALGGDGFRILSEVLPLAVVGEVSGGPYAGIGLATKGGLIGDTDAATLCVNALQQASRHAADVTLVSPATSEGK
ncbi:four-carbon acid sugar kinase family protein [Propionicicella superfundia]|uniref:four-carbon acid sugar kinase family protein n=1 Tax=Propionicicella superfundia TaxID=348582 RepID=UPI0004014F58|nr:four-carbon acid sugar kinase family protein [Propionicicella superfundia]